jgi:serine/threonine protein kinase
MQASARVIGRYVLFRELASGGMATVHFGRLNGPAGFARTVAIKRLHPQFAQDPDFVSMFLDEARLAARIQHPNVVSTLDVVTTENEIFLVLEYVQGESLARLMRAVSAMMTAADTRVTATIMAGVLHGLHAAHEAKNEQGEPLGIVHRDVSPQNILVGVDGVPRVLDFGVAKAVGRLQTTREGQMKGKLAYMAPEQLHGSLATRQTDVYAAAVVTWEALTGKRLFQLDNEAAVITAILQKSIRPPSEVASHVPLAFDRVVMRGLEREPDRRYATAREMAVELERCVGVASASEVGEWVEALAHDELLKRASRVAEIESVSSPMSMNSMRSLPSSGEIPTTVTSRSAPDLKEAQGELRSDVSSIAVSPILSAFPRRPRARAVIWGAGLAGVLGLPVLLLLAFRADRSGARTATPAAALSSAALAASVSPTPVPALDPVPTAAPLPTGDSSAGTPVATATMAATTPLPTHHHSFGPVLPPKRAAGPAPGPALDCDPPFSIDAAGHKHYKPACVQ